MENKSKLEKPKSRKMKVAYIGATATIIAAFIMIYPAIKCNNNEPLTNSSILQTVSTTNTSTTVVREKKPKPPLSEIKGTKKRTNAVSGKVEDAGTALPLKDVRVSTPTGFTTTDANGVFKVDMLDGIRGDHTIFLKFTKPGYSQLERLYPIEQFINVSLKKE